MGNIDELLKMFQEALENRSDVVLDPYDYGFLMRIMETNIAIHIYENLASLLPEVIEDGVAETHEIILIFNRELFTRIIKELESIR